MNRTVPAETLENQARASDPGVSAWVSANAGSGKTFVLSRRVIRLLLAGVPPSRILCLTYTRAAAAQMSNRVFGALSAWAVADDAKLASELAEISGRPALRSDVERARTLFALALDTPGGLKIQTIHAFCEALLHQFPLEANVPGHFEVMDEVRQQELLAQARRLTLGRIEAGEAELARAFAFLLDRFGDHAIEKALSELVQKRQAFDEWAGGGLDAAFASLLVRFGFPPDTTETGLLAAQAASCGLTDAEWAFVAGHAAAAGTASSDKFADGIAAMLAAPPASRPAIRSRLLLTGKGDPRKSIVTKPVAIAIGGLADKLVSEAERAVADNARIAQWRMLEASRSLFVFGDALLGRFASLKRGRGLVDFDDLIGRAANLLGRAEVREWVRYKLDRGIDHVLIDEAQDTSPRQWAIVDAIVAEFHAGAGAGRAGRTVFAVGDEKQSIYSFQGADPAGFVAEGRKVEGRARGAGMAFARVPLNLSFRSSPDVLGAVDAVFEIADHARGLTAGGAYGGHEAIRAADPGEVQIWPLERVDKPPEKEDWLAPLDAPLPGDPAVNLARRIAETVQRWTDTPEILPGTGKAIRPGDILILVRKRDRFMTAAIRELKERGVPIAGADRLKLTGHIAVQDLVALGRVMLMPQDDLSLAAVLKSPLFNVSEEELLALASRRNGAALFDHLIFLAGTGGETARLTARIVSRLSEMLRIAPLTGVHGFYARVLGRLGGRRAFAERLGAEAVEPLDAFEAQALEFERQGGGGLEEFLAALALADPQIKREADLARDEVRVLTVHGAKGLEAPIVFLVDPSSPAWIGGHAPAVVTLPELAGAGDDAPLVWAPAPARSGEIVGRRFAELKEKAEEEYRRLLYVGMTRAADRLVVCGYRGKTDPSPDNWHGIVDRALRPGGVDTQDFAGRPLLVWRKPDPQGRMRPKIAPDEPATEVDPPADLPDWLREDARREPAPPRPLNPSSALALTGIVAPAETDALPADLPDFGAQPGARADALARGAALHRLVQILPDAADRARLGRAFLAAGFARFPGTAREAWLAEALRLVADPALAVLFGPGSRAEAEIAGSVTVGGRDVPVSGQIDRLAVTDSEVVIADFKTNRIVPASGAPPAHVLQLALYRALLAQIYPGKRIRCLIVWTATAAANELSDAEMDAALAAISLP